MWVCVWRLCQAQEVPHTHLPRLGSVKYTLCVKDLRVTESCEHSGGRRRRTQRHSDSKKKKASTVQHGGTAYYRLCLITSMTPDRLSFFFCAKRACVPKCARAPREPALLKVKCPNRSTFTSQCVFVEEFTFILKWNAESKVPKPWKPWNAPELCARKMWHKRTTSVASSQGNR